MIAGGASAALTGLLFVAVSISIDRIVPRRDLRSIAGATLALLLTPLIVSILAVIPGQPRWVLGVAAAGPPAGRRTGFRFRG